MPTRNEWRALAERCEKATGYDLELDHALGVACRRTHFHPPHIIDSLSTIVALAERGFRHPIRICIVREYEYCNAEIDDLTEGDRYGNLMAFAERKDGHVALALCAAYCRAKAEEAGE